MPAVVATLTRPSYGLTKVRSYRDAHLRVNIFDLTLDTGTYSSGGISLTAAQLGLKEIWFVTASAGVATTGTAGATGSPVGITFSTVGTSITVQLYEGSAAGTALTEKTNAEAIEANFTIRLRAEGK